MSILWLSSHINELSAQYLSTHSYIGRLHEDIMYQGLSLHNRERKCLVELTNMRNQPATIANSRELLILELKRVKTGIYRSYVSFSYYTKKPKCLDSPLTH
jgi:hypothetical protein